MLIATFTNTYFKSKVLSVTISSCTMNKHKAIGINISKAHKMQKNNIAHCLFTLANALSNVKKICWYVGLLELTSYKKRPAVQEAEP